MMKIAFITHTTGVGGAAISATTNMNYLLDNDLLKPEDCVLIYPAGERLPPDSDVYYSLKRRIDSYAWTLPFSLVFKGATTKITSKVYRMVMTVVSMIQFLTEYNKMLVDENIDVVHLNSMVLWPLLLVLPKNIYKVIHIRELQNTSLEVEFADVAIRKYADAIIAIDGSVGYPYCGTGKVVTVPNPFDMCDARYMRPFKYDLKYDMNICNDTFVVSMFGPVGRQKGTDILIQVAMAAQAKDIVFLVVGKPEDIIGHKYVQTLQRLRNVKYIEENRDTSELYAITDVMLRCEDYLPIGRTIWEGIYSGGVALVPVGKKDNIHPIQDYIERYIYTYKAKDAVSCLEALVKIMNDYPGTVIDSGFPECENVEVSAKQMLTVLSSRKS